MIASVDGSTSVNGRSGGLGNEGDRAVFAALRRAAGAILVGVGDRPRRAIPCPPPPGTAHWGRDGAGDVDLSTDLFPSGAGFLVMPEDGPPAPTGIDAVRAGRGRVDLALALRRLDAVMDPPSFVQVEGGARLNGSLLDAACVDELNLTIAPLVVGGAGSRLIAGAADATQRLQLAHLLVDDDGYLFSRWVRRS